MKKSLFLTPLFITALTLTAAVAGPGSHCGGGFKGSAGKRPHRMLEALDLTDQQKEQMKALHEEMSSVRKQHWQETKALRDKLREELEKENPDQNQIDAYIQQVGKQAETMARNRTDHLLKIKEVLTAEQFETLLDKERMMQGCKRGRGRKGPRGGSVQ